MNKIRLIVDFENFELIKSGQKKEEFRSNNEKYAKLFANWSENGNKFEGYKQIDSIIFQRGYTKETIEVECNLIECVEWRYKIPEGFKKGDVCYVLTLGEIIEAA